MKWIITILWLLQFNIFIGCSREQMQDVINLNHLPEIEPDYSEVTIPSNIAPLNFRIKEEGDIYIAKAISSNGISKNIYSKDGIISFPVKDWKTLLSGSREIKIEIGIIRKNYEEQRIRFKPISIFVAPETVDPYICYRLLYPGYETFVDLKIIQRNLENFEESSVLENQMIDKNCINCHSFNQRDPEKFLIQVRGSVGGTYFINGKEVTRHNLKSDNMKNNAVYPSWHPDGRFVAFSENYIIQTFHAVPGKRIEVRDLASSLVLYDTKKREIMSITDNDSTDFMETFPEWSPDGNYLYYCRAKKVTGATNLEDVRYDLIRRSFNSGEISFGKEEIVFNAASINKSISFPKISPDGRNLIFTLQDYGNFSIWHQEADLYTLNLQTEEVRKLDLNSDKTESYHSWSSNSKWIMFSSKRGDGLTARPYLAYISSNGKCGKPFILPQEDPTLYNRSLHTYNIPEFITGRIDAGTRDFANAAVSREIEVLWINGD